MSTEQAAHAGKPAAKLWTRDLVLIILVNLRVFTNHIMSLSTFPFFIQSLGGSEAVAGICAAAFAFVAVIIRPFVGWWLDNGVRKVALVVGLLLLGAAPLGYVFVPVLSMSIAFRMLHGIGLSFSNSTTATVASDVICRPVLQRAWAILAWRPPWLRRSHRRWALASWKALDLARCMLLPLALRALGLFFLPLCARAR